MKARPTRFATLTLACLIVLFTSACTTEHGSEQASAARTERECRSSGATGSRMVKPVCHTPEEWAIIDAQAADKEALQDEFFRRVGESTTLGPGPEFSPAGADPGGY
jgi:hypothetical protein